MGYRAMQERYPSKTVHQQDITTKNRTARCRFLPMQPSFMVLISATSAIDVQVREAIL